MPNQLDSLISKHSNQLNSYMLQYVKNLCHKQLDEEMCQEAIRDGIKASEFGVVNDIDFKTFFYIEHFVDLEAEEVAGPLSDDDKHSLKKFMFSKRHELDFSNLTSYRAAILLWMTSRQVSSKAYVDGGRNPFMYKKYNLDEWKGIVVEINKLMALGMDTDTSMRTMVKSLDPQEQADFASWFSFNFGKNKNLYNVNDQIKTPLASRSSEMSQEKMIKVATVFEDSASYWAIDVPKPKPSYIAEEPVKNKSIADQMIKDQNASDMNLVKTKMINRTFAIDKLLEKYRHIFSEEQIDQIEDALNTLRKKIRKLRTASVINDTILKTANMFKNHQFSKGAEILIALAAPPEETPKDPAANKEMPSGSGKERSINELTKEDLQPLLEKLYDVSVRLKRRNIIREIAEIDLALYNLNVSSLFSELSDAQAKLIEAFGYASNKVEDVIPKLRSISMAPPPEANVSEEVSQELNKTEPQTIERPTAKKAPAPAAPTAPPAPPAAIPPIKPQGK